MLTHSPARARRVRQRTIAGTAVRTAFTMLLLRIAVKVAVVVGLFVAFIAVLVVLGMWASHMPAGSLP